jgi:neurotransmitter:Na+ symporter, NSS family
MENRGNFGSRFGILAAMAGSAVGLGNLWRFPYLVGTNGGAAFIIIYLVMVLVLCIPIMYAEFIIGRRAGANAFGAFNILAPSSKWNVIGLLSVLASLSILAFYSVVGGWTIDYLFKAATFKFVNINQNELNSLFSSIVSSQFEPILYLFIFLLATGLVVIAGVEKGIEKYSKIMMPALFIMVIIIAIRSITLPGSAAGISFLFKPDFSQVTSKTVLDAMGQAFFSLSLGMGCILTYASYVNKRENIVNTSFLTAISDTLFALIAGLAIMPAVFAFGMQPSEGPGLVFVILPHIFEQIPLGSILAILFFFALFIAAITSSISLFEVVVAYLKEEFKFTRRRSVIITFVTCFVLGILCSLSLGILGEIKILGLNMFDFFDKLSSNILLPLGGLLIVLFVGWRMPKVDFTDEITSGGTIKFKRWFLICTYFIIKYIAPIVVGIVMIRGLI